MSAYLRQKGREQGLQCALVDRIPGQIHLLPSAQPRHVEALGVERLNPEGLGGGQVPPPPVPLVDGVLPRLHVPVRAGKGAQKRAIVPAVDLDAPSSAPTQVRLPFVAQVFERGPRRVQHGGEGRRGPRPALRESHGLVRGDHEESLAALDGPEVRRVQHGVFHGSVDLLEALHEAGKVFALLEERHILEDEV